MTEKVHVDRDPIYLLLEEFNKTLQSSKAEQTQILSEIRTTISSVSERLARMEAQDLGKRIQMLDDDLRGMRDGEISRLKEKIQALEQSKPDLKPITENISILMNERLENKAAMRVWFLLASTVGSFVGALIIVVARAWLDR